MGFEAAADVIYEEVLTDVAVDTAAEVGTEAAVAEGAEASSVAAAGSGLGDTLISAATNVAAGYLISMLIGPRGATNGRPETSQGALVNTFSTVEPIPVVYGARRVGGVVVPLATTGGSNEYLQLLCIWGEGEIQAVSDVFLDGVSVSAAKFSGLVTREDYLGTDAQAASAALIAAIGDSSKWNSSCTLAGIAYTYLQLKFDATVFGRGRPLITADLQGRKVYDPRTGLTAYSRNPWLAVRDYLTNTRYGRGMPSALIDDTTFQTEATYAEQTVSIPNYTLTGVTVAAGGTNYAVSDTITVSGGTADTTAVLTVSTVSGTAVTGATISNAGSYVATAPVLGQASTSGIGSGATFNATWTASSATQARYTCDGVVNVDEQPLDVLRGLLSSCRGWLVYSGGVYKAKSDAPATPTTFVLNEDNIVGAWTFQLGSSRTRFNRAKARFFNWDAQWQADIVQWPAPASTALATYLAQDSGYIAEPAQKDLPYTRDLYTAQQLVMIDVKKSRSTILVSLTATVAATTLEVGDVVPITHSTPGWPAVGDPAAGKLFRVLEIELLPSDEVRLALESYDATAYDLDALAIKAAPAQTSLKDPTSVSAPGVVSVVESQYITQGAAGLKTKATITWGAAADIYVAQGGNYQVETQAPGSSTWNVAAYVLGTQLSADVFDLQNGVWGFRVKAVNGLGASSAYATATQEIYGLNAAPSNVANFAVQSAAGLAKFTWDKPSSTTAVDLAVLLVGRVFVRWSPKTSGAVWADGILVNPDGYPGDTSIGFGPLESGSYMAKLWNSKAYSFTEQTVVVTEALLSALSTLTTVTESPGFAGAKSNVTAIDGGIQLDSSTAIDAMLTNVDVWDAIDAIGGLSGSGSYTFNSKLDLGSKRVARLYSSIASSAFDAADFIDSRTNNVDSWTTIDVGVEDAEVSLWVRHTDDDPAGAPTWSSYERLGLVADYNFRAFDFRLDFATGSPTHNRSVTALSVTAKA